MNEPTPPRLLVSVRHAAEARAAVAGGCDILDIKEPARGSLGMANVGTMAEIISCVRSTAGVPVSAALGETVDWLDAEAFPALPAGLCYVKIGLSALRRTPDWPAQWLQVRRRFDEQSPGRLRWIGVVYVDRQMADSPSAEAVIAAAAETGCAGMLFDTFGKSGGTTLLDWLEVRELAELSAKITDAGLLAAFAGGITTELLSELAVLNPDIIAIRSAACRDGERNAAVDPRRIQEFRAAIRSAWKTVKIA